MANEGDSTSLDTVLYRISRLEKSLEEKFDRVVYRDMYELRHAALMERIKRVEDEQLERERDIRNEQDSARRQRIAMATGVFLALIAPTVGYLDKILGWIVRNY